VNSLATIQSIASRAPRAKTRDLTAGSGLFAQIPNVNSCGCLFACKWVNDAYWGPIIQLRRSNDNLIADFYIDASGINIGTALGGKGTSLSTWLGGNTAYVVIWYDQSKSGRIGNNNATQSTQSSQPIFDTVNKYITFNNTQTLVITTMPLSTGNVSYTIFTKIGSVSSTANTTLMTIGNRVLGQNVAIVFTSSNQPQHNWVSYQWIVPTTITNNAKMTIMYDLTKRYMYINGTEYSIATTGHNQVNGLSELGWKNYVGSLTHFWVYNTNFTATDRALCETI